MRKNQLGKSDLFVSEIGFGCMSLPLQDESYCTTIIHEAIDRGVNFFDTADLYSQGKNEVIVGNALHGKRSQVLLATKVGNRWEEGKDGWQWGPSKKYILTQVDTSLKRLRTDYIDLYQLHGGTLEDPIDEIIEAFEELKKAGKIREYGISSIRPKVIEQYLQKSNLVSVMSQYSILDRRPESEILPLLTENKVSLIARGPLAKGILSNHGNTKIPEDGYLDFTPEELLYLLKQLQVLCLDTRAIEHTALQFLSSHSGVATMIPGVSQIEQFIRNIDSLTVSALTDIENQFIRSISKQSDY